MVQILLLEGRTLNPHEGNIVSSRSRNLSDLAKVPILPSVKAQGSPTVFVPSVLLSNFIFIAPKIDEIRVVLNNLNVDLGCFVETWVQEHITDQTVSAAGYNLIRRDRCVGQHGGVCAYIRKIIKYQVLENLFDAKFEVLWLTLRPPGLSRGIPNIILGVVYHPPGANCPSMMQYLYECLTIIESKFTNNGTILGDFNKLKVSRIQNVFNLKQVVKFPTRGRNILDLL